MLQQAIQFLTHGSIEQFTASADEIFPGFSGAGVSEQCGIPIDSRFVGAQQILDKLGFHSRNEIRVHKSGQAPQTREIRHDRFHFPGINLPDHAAFPEQIRVVRADFQRLAQADRFSEAGSNIVEIDPGFHIEMRQKFRVRVR
jgi:hypothetical protein